MSFDIKKLLKYSGVYFIFACGFLFLVSFLLNDNSPVSDEFFYRNFFGTFSYEEFKSKFLIYREGRNPPLYPYMLNVIFNFVDYNIYNHRLISTFFLLLLNIIVLIYLYPNLLNSFIGLLVFNTSQLMVWFFIGRVYSLVLLLTTILVLGKRVHACAASFLGVWSHYTFPVFGGIYFLRQFLLKKPIYKEVIFLTLSLLLLFVFWWEPFFQRFLEKESGIKRQGLFFFFEHGFSWHIILTIVVSFIANIKETLRGVVSYLGYILFTTLVSLFYTMDRVMYLSAGMMFVYLALFQALKKQEVKKKSYIIIGMLFIFLLLYNNKIYNNAHVKTKSFQFQKEFKKEVESSASVFYSASKQIFTNDKIKYRHAGGLKYLIENGYMAKYDYIFSSVDDFEKIPNKEALLVLSYWDNCLHKSKITKILIKKGYIPYKDIRNGPECYLIYYKNPYEGLKDRNEDTVYQ